MAETLPLSQKSNAPFQPRTFTIRGPKHAYIHLQLLTLSLPTTIEDLDIITARSYIMKALSQFLGISGEAIAVDVLKVEGVKRECWIRVSREDLSAVVAGLGGWVDAGAKGSRWIIKGFGNWLGVLGSGERSIWDN